MKKKVRKIVEQIKGGSHNISVSDVRTLLKEYNFVYKRTRGSHEIWFNAEMGRRQVIKEEQGQVARYIAQQLLNKIEDYYGL